MLPLKPIALISVATGLAVMAFAGFATNTTPKTVILAKDGGLSSPSLQGQLKGIDPQLVAQKQPKVALVIGNAKYKEGGELANPVNDATDMAKALEKLGFEVTLLTNLKNKEAMQNAIDNFRGQLRQGGVGLFYYAGHGVQVQGKNYLIPIGESLDYEESTLHRTLSLNEVVDLMEGAKTQVNIIIIDACRNNPWYRRWYRATSSNGLAAVGNPPRGTIIAYATKQGSVAADGIGQRNSPFTSALLQYIQTPNLDVRLMFGNVIESVVTITKEKQEPWTEGNLRGGSEFYLNPQQPVAVSPPPPIPTPIATPSPQPSPQPTVAVVTPPRPSPSTSSNPQRSTLISSTTGVDYTPLRQLLQEKKWQEADQKTAYLMLAAAKREEEGWIDDDSSREFSCEDLRMIDQEWLAASGGKFGFSVQLAVYKQTGNPIGDYNSEAYDRFTHAVGWQVNGNWKKYSDLTWITNAPSSAPKGHLPWAWLWGGVALRDVVGIHGRWGGGGLALSSRAAACKL
jgi:hypothetical protein